MGNAKSERSIRVYLDPDLAIKTRKAARQSDASLSGFISAIVRRELEAQQVVADRNSVLHEYASIQLDLILAHLSPELKKKAREVYRARKAEGGLPLGEASNAL